MFQAQIDREVNIAILATERDRAGQNLFAALFLHFFHRLLLHSLASLPQFLHNPDLICPQVQHLFLLQVAT
jgi:hypothetical protein